MGSYDVREVLDKRGVIITNSHFVYASGKHGSAYVNKDTLYVVPDLVDDLCSEIALHFYDEKVGLPYEVVVGPEKGGIILAQWVGHNSQWVGYSSLSGCAKKEIEIHAVFAEKEYKTVFTNNSGPAVLVSTKPRMCVELGETLQISTGKFVFKRGYDKYVTGRKVLIVEDILTTGSTVKKVVEAVRAIGGEVVAVAALCNRGGVTAADIGDVPELFSLIDIALEMWDAENCPLCASGVPINTSVGKGQEFLDKHEEVDNLV